MRKFLLVALVLALAATMSFAAGERRPVPATP